MAPEVWCRPHTIELENAVAAQKVYRIKSSAREREDGKRAALFPPLETEPRAVIGPSDGSCYKELTDLSVTFL